MPSSRMCEGSSPGDDGVDAGASAEPAAAPVAASEEASDFPVFSDSLPSAVSLFLLFSLMQN